MKHIKMVLYGEPGVGKSVFALKAPKPFFITTDGNYEYLEEFGAKEEDHVEVSSWSQAKKEFAKDLDNYETIVVDLTEDLFKWCEYEYCARNKFEHVSDVGYGKGYDITRNEFFIEICKLFTKQKNVILIMHGNTFVVKDRRGIEHTKYGPTPRMPDKLIDMIEGRVKYFLRCYLKAEEQSDGTIMKKRYLSLIPKENEFGIARGLDESKTPHDIPLDFNAFADAIGLDTTQEVEKIEHVRKKREKVVPVPLVDTTPQEETNIESETPVEQVQDNIVTDQEEALKVFETPVEAPAESIEETKVKVESATSSPVEMSNEDKIAAIKAKLAALKNQK